MKKISSQKNSGDDLSAPLREVVVQPTGIDALDEVLQGGFPRGSVILLSGPAGAGKTILAQQWLFEGNRKFQEKGLCFNVTETVSKTVRNARSMSFFDDEALSKKEVCFVDFQSIISQLKLSDKAQIEAKDVHALCDAIANLVLETGAQRVVIDSITAILCRLREKDAIHHFVFQLSSLLSHLDATVLLLSEVMEREGFSVFGVEEFIADGIIYLSQSMGELSMIRHFTMVKMRGKEFRSGAVVFDITPDGIQIYPKMRIDRKMLKTDFSKKKSTGNGELDVMVGGGYPEGHIILIGGNTGAGKTTFGFEFLYHGAAVEDEAGVFVAVEEPVDQVKKTSAAHGWDLEKLEKEKKIAFVNPDIVDINPDKLLRQIINAAESVNAKRMHIDSISSVEGATLNEEEVRQFLWQLSTYLKSKGITCTMTYLTTEVFAAQGGHLLGGSESSELRLSSIVDGILLLRYVEHEQSVKRLITVLKMRGSMHDRDIREYNIEKGGIKIGKKFGA